MVTFAPPGADFRGSKVYYSNARRGGKTMLLCGPFLTAQEAELTLEIVGPVCVNENPETRLASFGVVEMKAPGDGPGPYNHLLPDNMRGNLGIGVMLN